MRYVITGGSGLIGRKLAAELAITAEQVAVVSRSPEVRGLPPGVVAVPWNGRSAGKELVAAIDGCTAVVHLAGENIAAGRWTAQRKERILASRVDSTRAVVEAIQIAEVKPKVLAQASAVGFYGTGSERSVTEAHPAGSGFLADVCRQWEDGSAAVEELGVRRVVLRTGVVLSSRGGALPRMVMPFKFFVGGIVGSGSQGFPWIHEADEVGAIRFLLKTESARGAYNLAAPEALDNRQWTRYLAATLRRPSLFPVPGVALRALFGDMAQMLLEGHQVVPERLLAAGFKFKFANAEEALADLLLWGPSR